MPVEYYFGSESKCEGRVVHLKGFASNLDIKEDASTKVACSALLDTLKNTDADTVAWDGDAWNEKSYTVLLPCIVKLGYKLIAFRRVDDEENALNIWADVHIKCYLLKARDYIELGSAALRLTRSTLALCLGGGKNVAAEAKTNPHVIFKVFDCGRWHRHGFWERPSLVSGNNVQLIVSSPQVELDQICGTPARYFLTACPHGLYITASSLTNCGLGLFTAIPRTTNEQICIYHGTALTTHEALRLPDKSYLMRLGQDSYVDARTHRDVLARYINDPRHPRAANVIFSKLPKRHCALVLASRPIAAGEELFVSYGSTYWLAARISGLILPSQLPDKEVREILSHARRR